MLTRILSFTVLCGLAALQACTSVDSERRDLRGALADSRSLANEIDAWHKRIEGSVSETAIETIGSFQSRANTLLDTVAGASDNATTGLDLSGVKQALTAITEFDTSRIADASQSGRASVVHQFGSLARGLQSAVIKLPS